MAAPGRNIKFVGRCNLNMQLWSRVLAKLFSYLSRVSKIQPMSILEINALLSCLYNPRHKQPFLRSDHDNLTLLFRCSKSSTSARPPSILTVLFFNKRPFRSHIPNLAIELIFSPRSTMCSPFIGLQQPGF